MLLTKYVPNKFLLLLVKKKVLRKEPVIQDHYKEFNNINKLKNLIKMYINKTQLHLNIAFKKIIEIDLLK